MQSEVMGLKMFENIDVLELIPQRAPIVMITKLIAVDAQSATSLLNITTDNFFVENGRFQESGLIENIAQTAAAMSGYNAKVSGDAVMIGYIGAIKNLQIYLLPKVNTTLITVVTIEYQVMNVNIINGKIRQGDELIAECEMKVFMQE